MPSETLLFYCYIDDMLLNMFADYAEDIISEAESGESDINITMKELQILKEESVQDMFKAGFTAEIKLTEEELMIGELARLQTLMMLYENKEEYEKAAVLLKKVNDIKKRLR